MDRSTFQKIEKYMLSCMEDSAHDAEHIYRVLSNAVVIAREETGVDYDILICACLLHDIGRPDQIRNPSLCHAAVGSEKAYQFLLGNGFDSAFATAVRDCIRTHRFRKNDQPESLEAKILFDADKLDVVGAVGIARTLVYKGTVTEPLYTRRPDGGISDGAGEEPHSFFQEYHRKLNKLYDRFFTAAGHRLAQDRRAAAQDFYNALYSEVTALDEEGKRALNEILQ
ncbi:MAG: HD domain-containing protein [Oscillospiraceae bacterium]|nr:HD domain-containing protein [Oscillospiraceae bacterium]